MELQRHASILIRQSNELLQLTGNHDSGAHNDQAIREQIAIMHTRLNDLAAQLTPEEKSKERQAIEAAESTTLYLYTDLSRHTIRENWQLEPEEFAQLEFNKNGYLACGIASSKVIEHITEPEEEWHIEVTADLGVEVAPETWRVYQGEDGKWIVEAD